MLGPLLRATHSPRHVAFVVASALMLATQSRALLGGVGLGEIAGTIFIGLTLRLRHQVPLWATLSMATLFTGFVVGATVNQITGLSAQVVPRDIAALGFALVFAGCSVAHLRSRPEPTIALGQALSAAILVQSAPLLMLIAGIETHSWLTFTDEPGIPFLSRYTGFSDNPNQLGGLLCAYPPVAIACLWRAPTLGARIGWCFSLLATIGIATLVASNTVFSAYILSAMLWAVLRFNQWGAGLARPLQAGRVLATLAMGSVATVSFLLYASESINKTGDADANGRFPLWLNAVDGIMQSGFLGVGPGGQTGETGPFEGWEAHNFLLDITLQGGLLSLLAYLLLLVGLLRQVMRSRSLLAAAVLLAILTQQLSHYTARQPIAWLYVLVPLALGARGLHRQAPSSAARPRPRPSGLSPYPAPTL